MYDDVHRDTITFNAPELRAKVIAQTFDDKIEFRGTNCKVITKKNVFHLPSV